MQYYPYTQPLSKDMLEIVDAHDKPLMVAPYKEAKHHPHRFVMLIVRDAQGKFLLWRNKKKKSTKKQSSEAMGLLYAHVQAGEARESAALRLMEKYLPELLQLPRIAEELAQLQGQQSKGLSLQGGNFPAPFTGHNAMTLYNLALYKEEKTLLHKDLLWLDFDELQGFATHFSSMLNPATLEFIQGDYLQNLYAAQGSSDVRR